MNTGSPISNRANRGELLKVIGQCDTIEKYSHNYLGCRYCKVNKNLRCFLPNCPCFGEGYLFGVECDPKCYSHQVPGHVDSVRIYLNRPSRAIKSVEKSMRKNEKICSKRHSYMRHRSVLLERIENGTLIRRCKRVKKEDTTKSIDYGNHINNSAGVVGISKIGDDVPQEIIDGLKSVNKNNLINQSSYEIGVEELDSIPLDNLMSFPLEEESDEDDSQLTNNSSNADCKKRKCEEIDDAMMFYFRSELSTLKY